MVSASEEVSASLDGDDRPTDSGHVTPLRRLLVEVMRLHPDWTQSAVAQRAGVDRRTLSAWINTPGRLPTLENRRSLAKALRIPQEEVDAAVAEHIGLELRPEGVDFTYGRLVGQVKQLPVENRERWLRLARALADSLASEDQDSLQAKKPTGWSLRVTTRREDVGGDIPAVTAGAGNLPDLTDEQRAYMVTLRQELLEQLRGELLGE